jgi:hypothetical protein
MVAIARALSRRHILLQSTGPEERVVCVLIALLHRQSRLVHAAAVTQPARSPRAICVFTALNRPDRLVLSRVPEARSAHG